MSDLGDDYVSPQRLRRIARDKKIRREKAEIDRANFYWSIGLTLLAVAIIPLLFWLIVDLLNSVMNILRAMVL